MAAPEPLMTPDEVAALLSKPVATLRQWRWQRIGPEYLKLEGGSVRYRPEAVEEWLRKQAVPA